MAVHRQSVTAALVITSLIPVLVLFNLAGCAQQDLYEPPGAPFQRVGRVPLPSENEGVAALDRFAFVAGGQAGLHAIDFSDPSHPVLLQTLDTTKYSESVEVVRRLNGGILQDFAHVVEGTEGVTSYDITDPAAMIDFGTGTTAVFGNRIAIVEPADPDSTYAVFLAESWKGVRLFTSSALNPGTLEYNGVFSTTNGYAEGIVLKDGYAYVADDQMGVAVLDARDRSGMALVSWCDSPGEALDIDISGDHAYVADGDDGLAVFSINGAEAPVHLAQLALEGECRAIAVKDGLAVLCARGSGVHFVDVSDPGDPIFLGRILTEYAMDLAITHEGIILVADRDEGLIIMQGNYPFTDTTPPLAVTTLTAETSVYGSVELSWLMTGDDRLNGTASSVEIRYSDTPITDETAWAAATPAAGSIVAEAPGTMMTHVVGDLAPGQLYHFAAVVRDDGDNRSDLGNTPSASAGEGILLVDADLDIRGGTIHDTYTYRVTYVSDLLPVVHEVIIDGTAHAMSETSTGPDGSITFGYQTTLARGVHDFAFHFEVEAEDVPPATTETEVGPVVGTLAFTMGSPDIDPESDPDNPDLEPGREPDEWRHRVVFSDSLVGAAFEVTQDEWTDLGMTNNSLFFDGDRPVETLTWLEAVQYCNLLSDDQGLTPAYAISGNAVTWNQDADGWRLPTEAEWEYLSRGGATTAFAAGPLTGRVCNADPVLLALGWYCGSDFSPDGPGTRPVGQLDSNAFGLHDMHGNVWEWCWDWYGDYEQLDLDGDGVLLDPTGGETGFERVIRGGSWENGSEACRSANRGFRFPDSADDQVGLRVVRTIFVEE